jgi:hypothetical protein
VAQDGTTGGKTVGVVGAIVLYMTLLLSRVDALLPVPAVAPRPPLVHVPA